MVDPTAEVDAYVRHKQISLGRELAPQTKIYLDLNFWIAVREAALGMRTDAAALKLLHLLRRGVARGLMVCPVGDSVFMELMKQPLSEDRRIGTARVVDELSLGVSLLTSQMRIGTEIYQALHQLMGRPEPLLPMQDLVWTKVCHILGPSYPVSAEIEPKLMVHLQKKTMDSLWDASLTDMIEQCGDHDGPAEDYRPLTEDTNRQRDLYADEITSYEAAYDIELRGGVDAVGALTADVLTAIGEKAGWGVPPAPGHEPSESMLNLARNTLLHAFRKGGAAKIVRTLHIETALHAMLRVEKKRRFKPNDWHDFRHAAAALAYCNLFFTEGPLHELVARPKLGLLGLNGCKVASTPDDAVELLRAVSAEPVPAQ
jgi:hypothetical protein